ncbi:Predicted membrane protein [Rhizobium sp. RU20A]|uniref:DUF2207 domain-containing protein n=1 Tax=Rhizobium sp. RU20A TaxID=1907412 RepID=UPI0009547CA4|nr:DUF2207 domain-containing protein [Rhizobium sp. RU20A]SIR08286.1 Predicted membrane protein [Rhizobium sp. RU20A]
MARWFGRLLLLLALLAGQPAAAAEVINGFDAVIDLSRDGDVRVSETITVTAEGNNIRRGIFRDFPTTMVDAAGRRQSVAFDVQSVERDGSPEPFALETISGGQRLRIGSADTLLDPGRHTYVITYRTDRQIRFFTDHDEFYWNVTGNGWAFPILSATATVTLPDGARPVDTVFFTGPQGATGKDARVRIDGDRLTFATTRALGAREGLTIAVKVEKGVFAPPSDTQQTLWLLRDFLGDIIAYVGLAAVLAYYTRFWWLVGRDPPAGTVVPRWDAPEGLSPALVNYVDNTGFSSGGWTALSAAAISLAVSGYLTIEDLKRSITLKRTPKPVTAALPPGEAALLKAVDQAGGTLVIDSANGTAVKGVGEDFRAAIEKEHRGRYYRHNTGYVIGGAALSALFIGAIFLFGNPGEDIVGMLFAVCFSALFLGTFAVQFGKGLRRHAPLASRIGSIVALGFIGFVAVSIGGSVIASQIALFSDISDLPLLIGIGGIVLVNVLFFFLMGAPTPLGRRLMNGVEGLRLYLTVAERDRMNMQGAPAMSPQHFETLLPYAVALGVEKPWSRTFEAWLATAAGAAAAAHQPGWYIGDLSRGFGRIGSFSSSMATTIASTLPQPQSSSSSGFSGGSSGGGGGGGGGGGW